MEVEVNAWGVVAAVVASMVVGMAWYSKQLFLSQWVKLAKVDEKRLNKEMPKAILANVLMSGVMAYVLAHITFLSYTFFGYSYLSSAITTAFWVWLGFVATIGIRQGAFEQRDMKLTTINLGGTLLTFIAMGAAIGLAGL